MPQQSNDPIPKSDSGNQQKKMPYGGRQSGLGKDGMPKTNPKTDGEMKETFQALFAANNLKPGMGLGTKTWDPETGIRREQQRRAAKGMSAQDRMKVLTDAGVSDRDGMIKVFERAYSSPERAFMLSRR